MSIDSRRLLLHPLVSSVQWLDETDSTNTRALQSASPASELPLLIGAERQTLGRGRGNNAWWSCSGSLTFSLLLEPARLGLSPQHWPLISLATGLAAAQALDRWLPQHEVRLKWPNDVYADGRKIAGILIENIPDQPQRLIIGVGLNVNNSLLEAPADVQARATSLLDLSGQLCDRTDVLVAFLDRLQAELTELALGTHMLIERCRARCYLIGRTVTLHDGRQEASGACQGIDDDGALRLMTPAGPQRFLAGVISAID
jgi:BirA family biotin operon repressor/biotin-[acetyl-CoA-carboxylase] ligase